MPQSAEPGRNRGGDGGLSRRGERLLAQGFVAARGRLVRCATVCLGAGALVSCGSGREQAWGDPRAGATIIAREACGSCHVIPGIPLADGHAGPPLARVGGRMVIAGRLTNSRDNMVRWLVDPQAIEPGTAMPTVGLDRAEARDVAAYLFTLR